MHLEIIQVKKRKTTKLSRFSEKIGFWFCKSCEIDNIKNLITRILGIINVQLQEIQSNEIYQEFKRGRIESWEGTLSREVTAAVEALQELKDTFGQDETEGDDFGAEDDGHVDDDDLVDDDDI